MNTEQLNQISSTEFDDESMQTLMSELGLDMVMETRVGGNKIEGETGTGRSQGGNSGPMGGGRESTNEQRAMKEAMSDKERATVMGETMNTVLLVPLIALLEEIAAQQIGIPCGGI